jgi:hypothetical protein
VSGICATVIHRLLQLACPPACTAISALLTCSELSRAERLLQNSIKDLSSSVPPQAPRLNDWLLLALFSLLRNDTATAASYLRQADWKSKDRSPDDASADRLSLVLQLSRCLEAVMSGGHQTAEDLLDACESQPDISRSPERLWLVLQLRQQLLSAVRTIAQRGETGRLPCSFTERRWIPKPASRNLAQTKHGCGRWHHGKQPQR